MLPYFRSYCKHAMMTKPSINNRPTGLDVMIQIGKQLRIHRTLQKRWGRLENGKVDKVKPNVHPQSLHEDVVDVEQRNYKQEQSPKTP